MTNLDIIIIQNSGRHEQPFAEKIFKRRNNPGDRFLWFFPRKEAEQDNRISYKIRTDKKTFQINCNEFHNCDIYPYFILNPTDYETWLNNPAFRLSDDPKPENAVLLVDDHRNSGRTIFQTQTALVSLGYTKEKIYSYAHTLDISSEYELKNSANEVIPVNNFLKSAIN